MRNICRDLNCSNYYNYNLTGCINEIPEGYYCNDSNHKTIDKCNIKCKSCSYDSTENDLCLSCNTINNYYPLDNYNWSNESYKQCFNFTPEGYAFEEGFYKPCYQTCKSCSLIGNKTDNKCDECISNHAFIFHEKNKNCYEKCPFYYYFDSKDNYFCTDNDACPDGYKLIKYKNKCINNCSNEDLYRYEYNNSCYETCPNNTNNSLTDIFICEKIEHNLLENHSSNFYTNIFSSIYTNINIYKNINTYTIDNVNVKECEPMGFLKGSCSVNSDNVSFISKDKLIEKIKSGIQNGAMDELISNVLGGDKKDYLYKDDNIIYQITSTYNQNNNQNNNISTIILGE